MGIALTLFYFGIPLLLAFLKKRLPVIDKVGVVTLSYIAGIILGNVPGFHVDETVPESLMGPVVALAIPLLLFSTRIRLFRTSGPALLKSFVLCIIAVSVASSFATWIYSARLDEAWQIGAMTFGVYTGGTVNLSAIGLSLGADESTIVLVNAADVMWGGLLLLFLLTISKRVYSRLLPFEGAHHKNPPKEEGYSMERITVKGGLLSIVLAAAMVASGAGISILINGDPGHILQVVMFLTVTVLGIGASLISAVRKLPGSYVLGDYLLNVFCVAIGSLASVRSMYEAGLDVLGFVGLVFFGSLLAHLILSRIFRMDADSALISMTAGLYGPPFVPPVARAIGASPLVPIGITLALIGFAVGNWGGIALGQLFKALFG